MQWKNIIGAVGVLVVISAVRMGKYPLFVNSAQREAFIKKVEAQKPKPTRELKFGKYGGVIGFDFNMQYW